MISVRKIRNSLYSWRFNLGVCQAATFLLLSPAFSICQTPGPVRVAVLDLGSSATGVRAAAQIRDALRPQTTENRREFEIVDPDQASVAAHGTGFNGSLNLMLTEARDLGAAIGCDFFIIGDAQTVRRSPSAGPLYYESYASTFLVSAHTGKLILWERPEFQRATLNEAEQALLTSLVSPETRNRYAIAMRRAQDDERVEHAHAIEGLTPVIEPMADDQADAGSSTRAPRPFRRLKPPYPENAARAEVEATVDVLVEIDAKGEVGSIEVSRWAGHGLDQSVVETVRQMHFFPAMRDGVAIPLRVLLRYNFRKPPSQNQPR